MAIALLPYSFFIQFSASAAGAGIGLRDLGQGLSDAEKAFDTFSLQARLETYTKSPTTGQNIGPLAIQASYTVDGSGRCRYESAGEVAGVGGDKKPDYQTVAIDDGKTLKLLEIKLPGVRRGLIAARSHAVPWQLDPREYLHRFLGKSVSAVCQESGARLLGEETFDDRKVYHIESAVVTDKSGGQWKCRFYVDPARQFAILRRSGLVRFAAMPDWMEYVVVEGGHYSEPVQGVWVPGEVVYEHYDINPAQVEARSLLSRIKISTRNWVISPELSDSHFELKFPQGTFVTDQISGNSFTVTEVTDRAIEETVKELQQTLEREKHVSPRIRRMALWGVLFLGLAASLGIILVRVYGKRNRIHP